MLPFYETALIRGAYAATPRFPEAGCAMVLLRVVSHWHAHLSRDRDRAFIALRRV